MEKQQVNQHMWRGKPMVRFHAMAKPIGPACNLDCSYCYYLSKAGLLEINNGAHISDELLEEYIKQYIEANNFNEVVFSWQGGEPTLLGLDFFKKVVALEKKYAGPHKRIENDLQTNGTLLNDEWCRFLKENNFLVGLSIDGPKELHDYYRKDKNGNGSFDRVFRSAQLLRKHNVDFATLTCVNRETAKHPLEVYRFLRDKIKSPRMQFIPIVEPRGFQNTAPHYWSVENMVSLGDERIHPEHPDSIVEDWCVDPDDFGSFLCTIFDEWYKKDIGRHFVHYFEAFVESWMGRINPLCTHGPMCGKGVALEHDGSIYSCDHYVYPEYRLGNIMDIKIENMVLSYKQEAFGRNKEASLPQYCRDCEYQFCCFGACPKDRFIKTPNGEPGLNYLCSGWKKFYKHIDADMQKIVRSLGYTPVKELKYAFNESNK